MATYVLIPGAGGSAWYWHRVAAELRHRGHEVVAVDLPAGDDTAGLEDYAETVVAAIGARRDIILVAHSLGGFTAPLVCARVDVDLLVMVNAMVPAPGETGADWWENTEFEQARRDAALREGRDPDADDDPEVIFFHDLPLDITAELMRNEPNQSGRPMRDPWPLERWPDVPTRFLACRDDRFFPLAFMRRVVRERAGVLPDEMGGGHLVALSRPTELADRLEAYRIALSPQTARA